MGQRERFSKSVSYMATAQAEGEILLSLTLCYPAYLTVTGAILPADARKLAAELIAAADKVDATQREEVAA